MAAPPPVVAADFTQYKLNGHVQEALQYAWASASGGPLDARNILTSVLEVRSNSAAFRQLSTLLARISLGSAKSKKPSPVSLSTISLTKPLADAFTAAEPFFRNKGIWGRDYITFALLAKDDPSLDQIARESGSSAESLRALWYEYVTTSGKHRTREEWNRWWNAAGLSIPYTFTDNGAQAFLFTWNPHIYPFPDMAAKIDEVQRRGWSIFSWGMGNRRSIPPDSRVFLLRQGDGPRGLVGIGNVHGEIQQDPKQNNPASVNVRWTFLSREPFISLKELIEKTGEKELWAARASGVQLPAQIFEVLEKLIPIGSPAYTVPTVAGYVSDTVPEGELGDELDIKEDVNTLCSVLLAKEVRPPLAIGLFGDWGTGKSYFMEAMYKRIGYLADKSKDAEHSAFHSSVVQIRFNAWHYLDANLWASLVSYIFDQLAEKLCPGETPEETKKRLLKELDSARQARIAASMQKTVAQRQKKTASNKLNEAIKARKNKELELNELRPADLLQMLTPEEREQLREDVGRTIDDLGLPPLLNSFAELQQACQDAASLAGRTRAVLLSFSQSGSSTALLVLLAVSFAVLPLAVWGLSLIKNAPWMSNVNVITAEVAAAISALALMIKKHVTAASRLVDTLEKRRDRALEIIRKRQTEKSEDEKKLEAELEALRGKEEIALRRLEEADSKVREIESKIAELDAGRSLSQFILERVKAEDYRKYLGIISTIRKDFERLGTLLKEGQGGLDKVGRIILYIDDLDRCPARKVVEVLQAVHLLLAMPLFVAVVGVDLRWLLHSLETQYTAFQNAGVEAAVRPEWATSPLNYLEKIFQIPFTLNRMKDTGYQNLVNVLLPETNGSGDGSVQGTDKENEKEKEQQKERQTEQEKGKDREKDQEQQEAEDQKEGQEKQEKKQDEAKKKEQVDLNPESLRIQVWERQFAETLFPFMPSPRAAKRFANVYRILKAPLSGTSLHEFEGTKEHPGHFQVAMLLLAVATGVPDSADMLFRNMSSGDNGKTWRDVFASNLSSTAEQLAVLQKVPVDMNIEVFQIWAQKVSRFTFGATKFSAPSTDLPVINANGH
jgi:hypothetical protein